jgi:hypothetical protein
VTSKPLWGEGAVESLDVNGLRQFWFNQLLAQSVAADPTYAEGFGVVVACRADRKAKAAAEAVSEQLAEPADLRFSPLEDVVASVPGHDEWKSGFVERYLDFSPIVDLLDENDPRLADPSG